MNEIKLDWQGPVDFSKINDEDYTSKWNVKDFEKAGIYIHCFKIPNQDKLAIAYVGKNENSIKGRNIEHIKNTGKGIYSLYGFNEADFLDIIYNQNDFKYFDDFKNDVEKNIQEMKLFYANCNAKDIYDFASLRPLEGAIQFHLYKKSYTRKYLTTNVCSYSLRNTKIINDKSGLDTDLEIVGLDDEMITYQD